MTNKEIDILIIGGGLTGATLMLALQGFGYSCLLVDTHALEHKIHPDFDARSLALSPASQRILTMLGVWEHLQTQATPIEMIHVSDQSHFGASRLYAEVDAPLGYVVEMQYINRALHQLLDPQQILAPAKVESLDLSKKTVTINSEAGPINVAARLIVAADGTHSALRRFCGLPSQTKLYGQQGIVANIGLSQPHAGRAYERFTVHGPLALLPMQENRMSLVWAVPAKEASQLLELSDDEFLRQLQRTFGYRLGRFTKTGKRSFFPLQQVLMPQQVKDSVVFVGNAAHTLHPVAGQGFNLGLRDVATLAQCIAKHGLNAEMLAQYVQLRVHDQRIIARFTDSLINLFTSRLPGIGIARGLGLVALDNIPSLKGLLARYARGFGGVVPDLVCEIALNEHEAQA
ncbi:MAG: 2-octaprenyl-6-methoxyphenol hydroxylase [Legionella sp.]|uniref:2-octaprenyl-6-methoxyphenyl hydroxylase n=1 Tax=Legionella sp. TaxID=459 RepID=UPI003D0E5AA9